MTYISHPTVEAMNALAFEELAKRTNPDVYFILEALKDTRINPHIVSRMIHSIHFLLSGSRYGKVTLFMQDGLVTQIRPEASISINELASMDEVETQADLDRNQNQ